MTDEAVKELYQLMSAMTDGALDDRQQSQLQELLRGDARAQRLYRDFMALHAQLFLEHTTGGHRNDAVSSSCRPLDALGATAALFPPDPRSRARHIAPWIGRKASVLAALALFSLLGLLLVLGGGDRKATTPAAAVGSFSRSANVQWSPGAHRWSVGDTLVAGESVAFDSGRVELQFDSGAAMTLVGPATLEIKTANLVALHSGTATTRIEDGNSGKFRVVTPTTEVLDLGTEFGVRARPDGQTEVVVFEGKVDVFPRASARNYARNVQRLSVGEAVCMNGEGRWERLVSIESDAFPVGDAMFGMPRGRPRVILGVTDNLSTKSRPKFYAIVPSGFRDDAKAYVDRLDEWNGLDGRGLPAELVGGDYIKTFNDDKHDGQIEIIVSIACPALLYVVFDDRAPVPAWLETGFELTELDVGLDKGDPRSKSVSRQQTEAGGGRSVDVRFSVWQRIVPVASQIRLGPSRKSPLEVDVASAMYGIVAVPLPVSLN